MLKMLRKVPTSEQSIGQSLLAGDLQQAEPGVAVCFAANQLPERVDNASDAVLRGSHTNLK